MATVSATAPAARISDKGGFVARRPATDGARATARILLSEFAAFAGRRRLAVAACLILAGAVLEGAGILVVVPLLQKLLRPGVGASAQEILTGLAALLGARAGALVARDTCLARLQHGFVEEIKLHLFHRMAAAPWKDVMAIDRARLVKALGGDMIQIGLAVHFALQAGAATLMLAAYCGFAIVLAPDLSLLTLGFLAAVGLAGTTFVRRAGAFGQALVRFDLRMADSAARFLTGLKLAKAQDLQAGFVDSYAAASNASVESRVEFVRVAGTSRQLAMLVGTLAAAAAVVVAVLFTDTEPALLVAFVVLLSRTAGPIAQLQQGAQQLANALPIFAELHGLGAELPEAHPETTVAAIVGPGPRSISFKSVSFVHGAARGGIRAADLDIAPGEFIGFAGPTGAGKSTLLDLVAGLERPQEGQIFVDGRELVDSVCNLHRRRLAYLGADPVLFAGTVRDNLAWAAPGADDAAKWTALEIATAADLINRLGNGLDSRLHEAGANLSAGERQQIALARALLRRPSLLLLDEATCSLDAARERQLLTNLAALEPRPTILIVSHRAESFALCNRVVTLAGGQIASIRRVS
jgi:ATP-binding cassette subfamily C protein